MIAVKRNSCANAFDEFGGPGSCFKFRSGFGPAPQHFGGIMDRGVDGGK
jgi:hypothetical protein